ncbi:MAG: ScpA family protein [Candidatus Paceibacterota bacterium]
MSDLLANNQIDDQDAQINGKKGFKVKTEAFEGPLDLLLSLIQKRKLFISDISLAQVTDDYLTHLQELEQFPVADSAQFILTSSTLVLIKSKSLLPTLDLTDEEEEDIEELEERLKAYQRIQDLSVHIRDLYGEQLMASGCSHLNKTPVFSPTDEITPANLSEAMRSVLSRLPKQEQIPQTQVKKVVSLKETIERLSERIQRSLRGRFSEFSGYHRGKELSMEERVTVVVSFLAMLELVKTGLVQVSQRSHFDEIEMEHSDIGIPRYNSLE